MKSALVFLTALLASASATYLPNPYLAALLGGDPAASLAFPAARAALSGAFNPSTVNVPAPATSAYPALLTSPAHTSAARFADADEPTVAYAHSAFSAPSVTISVPAHAAGRLVAVAPASSSYYLPARFAAAFAPSAFSYPTSSVSVPAHSAGRFINAFAAPTVSPAARSAAAADPADAFASSSFTTPSVTIEVPAYSASKIAAAAPSSANQAAMFAAAFAPSAFPDPIVPVNVPAHSVGRFIHAFAAPAASPAARLAAATDSNEASGSAFSTPTVSVSIPAFAAQLMDSESSPIYSSYAYAPAYAPAGYASSALSPAVFASIPYSAAKFVNAAASPAGSYAPAYTSTPTVSISARLFNNQATTPVAFMSFPASKLVSSDAVNDFYPALSGYAPSAATLTIPA